jgi:hypothetical protein
MTERQIVERIANAPMPDHPRCENRPQRVQNEPNQANHTRGPYDPDATIADCESASIRLYPDRSKKQA